MQITNIYKWNNQKEQRELMEWLNKKYLPYMRQQCEFSIVPVKEKVNDEDVQTGIAVRYDLDYVEQQNQKASKKSTKNNKKKYAKKKGVKTEEKQ